MINLEGIGVHTGSMGSVFFEKSSSGFHFQIDELSNHNKDYNLVPFLEKAQYGTVLKDPVTKKYFSTPEHLLAVLAGYSFLEISVVCKGVELPIGDGSGQPFFDGLERAWERRLPAPHFCMYPSRLKKNDEWKGGFLQVEPADSFEVHYKWENGPIKEEAYWSSLDSESFIRDIVPARTFITWKSFLQAKQQGLLKGTPMVGKKAEEQTLPLRIEGGGVLLAESFQEYEEACKQLNLGEGSGYPYIYSEGKSTKEECAKHKILDLIGDLALLGLQLPKLSCKVVNGGHYQHHQLLRDLFYEQQQ